ncbi:MAG: DNA polymerase III subunit delta [Phycisphaera sp.]|nr:DNA polymerase III subunit delta [Phycisphaera sp.]
MARRTPSKKSASPDTPGLITAQTRILVLYGKEEMLKRIAIETLRSALETSGGAVETFTFDGERATVADIFDELRSYGLMVSHKIVVVDAADEFAKNHRDVLERYAANPVDHATLVLRSDTWHKGKLDKLIEACGAVIKYDTPGVPEAQKWAVERSKSHHKRKLTPRGASALVGRTGPHLGEIDSELAKLALMTGEDEAIDEPMVREVVGQSSDEQAWSVQEAVLEAIASGRVGQAMTKLHELVDLSGQPDILVSYFVADLCRKMWLAKAMLAQGVSPGQVAGEFKLWGQRQTLFMSALHKLEPAALGRLFDRIIRYDARSKSGFGKAMGNLECFVAGLTDTHSGV